MNNLREHGTLQLFHLQTYPLYSTFLAPQELCKTTYRILMHITYIRRVHCSVWRKDPRLLLTIQFGWQSLCYPKIFLLCCLEVIILFCWSRHSTIFLTKRFCFLISWWIWRVQIPATTFSPASNICIGKGKAKFWTTFLFLLLYIYFIYLLIKYIDTSEHTVQHTLGAVYPNYIYISHYLILKMHLQQPFQHPFSLF